MPKLDRIWIRDLRTRCIIGFNPWEREKSQDVLLNITLHTDLSKPCSTDDPEDTVDYKTIKNQVLGLVESSEFQLVERLAEAVAGLCLDDPLVQRVDVTVDKPGALRFSRSVAVEITRDRQQR